MSRDHAEISLDLENKVSPRLPAFPGPRANKKQAITIQDIGSMHGTYLNNVELPRKSPAPLGNNDVVVFGAEVKRGPETFPACRFRVNVNFEPIPYK